jgi:hypothetical protein
MLPDLADLALSAVVDVMGQPIVYRRRGQQWPVEGVYQASHVAMDPDTGVQVRSTQPVVLISGADLPMSPQQGDEVQVDGTSFTVRDPQPDGHGGWLLMLHRASKR